MVADALQKRAREQQRAFQNLAWMNQLTPAATVAAAAAAAAAQQGLAYVGGGGEGATAAASATKHKRQHAKKKSKSSRLTLSRRNMLAETNGPEFGTNFVSDDEDSGGGLSGGSSQAAAGDLDDLERFNPAAPVFFRRKRNCQYLAPAVDDFGDPEPRGWPWDSPFDGGGGEPRYRFSLASLSTPAPRCVGLVRRRMGRGGRMVLDRASFPGADDQGSVKFISRNC